MRNSIRKEPQIKAPRVAPLEGAFTSTVAPVDVAHTYGSRHTWRDVSMHCGGHDADERRFIESGIKRIFLDYIYSNLINSPQRAQSSQRLYLHLLSEIGNILPQRHRTRIRRIFTDAIYSFVSAFICVHLRFKFTGGTV